MPVQPMTAAKPLSNGASPVVPSTPSSSSASPNNGGGSSQIATQNGHGSHAVSNNGHDSTGPSALVYPCLHMLPLAGDFAPKQIQLSIGAARVKIGRQTNQRTQPSPSNGSFDSKVLSRQHAEIWCEDGKIFIKDVKSSNGTFINGDRLSPESAESEPFELHSEDVVEFGIDIVSDDNKTIVHHKVSTKVYVVITADEAMAMLKSLPAMYRMHDTALHRRPSKSGLTFDHVFNRLQAELHKSRETGGELSGLTSAMADIHDTLVGNVPPPPPPAFHNTARGHGITLLGKANGADLQGLALLQAQLSDTQASLAGHVDKLRTLEGLALEHDAIRSELDDLRSRVDSRHDDDDAASVRSVETIRGPSPPAAEHESSVAELREQNAMLLRRLDSLTQEVRDANATERAESTSDIVRTLAARVDQLESEAVARETRWETWRQQFQSSWQQEQRAWEEEKAHLRAMVSGTAQNSNNSLASTSARTLDPPSSVDASSTHTDDKSTAERPRSRSRSRSRSTRRRRSQARQQRQDAAPADAAQSQDLARQTSSDSDATVASMHGGRPDVDPDRTAQYRPPKSSAKRRAYDSLDVRNTTGVAVGALFVLSLAYWLAKRE